MKKLGIVLIAVLGFQITIAQTTWKVDPSHSKVGFSVSHLLISEVEGQFNTYNATVIASKNDFSDATFSFEAKVNTIDTGVEKRDGHLQSEDFFYASKYPTIKFVSTSLKKKRGNKFQIVGNLTMRGVTKKITLDAKYNGTVDNDGYGNTKAGFTINGEINRIDFGVAWNSKTETGTYVVGEDVELEVKLQVVKQGEGS